MSKFKVNDRVMLRKDSQFLRQCPDKPGTILEITPSNSFQYRVLWDNESKNVYRTIDLMPIIGDWDV